MQSSGSPDDVALRKFIPNRTSEVRMTLHVHIPALYLFTRLFAHISLHLEIPSSQVFCIK